MLYNQPNCWKVYVLTVYINGFVIYCRHGMNIVQKHQTKSGGLDNRRAQWSPKVGGLEPRGPIGVYAYVCSTDPKF